MNKVLGAVGLAAAAPVLAGISFVYYVGYKVTAWAFKHPALTVGALALCSWYASQPTIEWSKTVGSIIHTYQDRRATALEHKVRDLERQKNQLDQSRTLEEQKRRSLEQQLQEYQKPEMTLHPKAIRDPVFNFYYVKPNDSLSSIAQKVTGIMGEYQIIKEDNGVHDQELTVGMILKIRKTLCRNDLSNVYEQIPMLKSVILPNELPMSVYFEADTARVLHINKLLGLPYADGIVHAKGARIIYY